MPLYLDVHHKINGLTTEGIADAHRKDLECQHKHGVNYLKYWFDEGTGKVFCLVQAPSKEAAEAVHRRGRGGDQHRPAGRVQGAPVRRESGAFGIGHRIAHHVLGPVQRSGIAAQVVPEQHAHGVAAGGGRQMPTEPDLLRCGTPCLSTRCVR